MPSEVPTPSCRNCSKLYTPALFATLLDDAGERVDLVKTLDFHALPVEVRLAYRVNLVETNKGYIRHFHKGFDTLFGSMSPGFCTRECADEFFRET